MKNELTLSGLHATNFCKMVDGKEVSLCVLINKSGSELAITNYGATIMVNKKPGELAFALRCTSPKTAIVMDVSTTEPGVQMYTGNWLSGNYPGKNRHRYPTTILRPGEEFTSQTVYKFSLT
jgi:galactose mutarotase-like enzyme